MLPHRDNGGRFEANWSGKDYTRSSFFGLAVTNWHDYATGFTRLVKEFDALSRGKRGINIGSVSSLTRMRPHQRFLSLSRTRAFPGFLALSVEKKTENYHRRIVRESDREVFWGHVARARCRDAALPDATAALNGETLSILLIYLNIQTVHKSIFLPLFCNKRKRIISLPS